MLTCRFTDQKTDLADTVDLVVALGGDGTVLHVASLFAHSSVPPVLGISMGTLGFLMPFGWFSATLGLTETKRSLIKLCL